VNTTTATAAPTVLRAGRTEYRVTLADQIADTRGPAFYLHGKRGATYMLVPAIDSRPGSEAWVLLTGNNSHPFAFAAIVDGEWIVWG